MSNYFESDPYSYSFQSRETDDDALNRLFRNAFTELEDLMNQLGQGDIDVSAWEERMHSFLASYHIAAFLVGANLDELSDEDKPGIATVLDHQYTFLNRLVQDLKDEPGPNLPKRYYSRAAQYLYSLRWNYSRGQTRGWRLPAYPGDGTTPCLTSCCCHWELKILGPGDVDATWRLGGCQHCGVCPQRAVSWAPFRIRNSQWVTTP